MGRHVRCKFVLSMARLRSLVVFVCKIDRDDAGGAIPLGLKAGSNWAKMELTPKLIKISILCTVDRI